MSATLKTQNYNLPVFAEEDFTDWSSYNESMEIIDASMQENKEKIETVEEAEQTGAAAIQQIQQSVVVINNTIQNQSQDLDSLTTRLENNESHDNDRDLAITAMQNEIQKNMEDIQKESERIDDIKDSFKYPVVSNLEKINDYIIIPDYVYIQSNPPLFKLFTTYAKMESLEYGNLRKIIMGASATQFTNVDSNKNVGEITFEVKNNSMVFYYGFVIYEELQSPYLFKTDGINMETRREGNENKKYIVIKIPNASGLGSMLTFKIIMYFYNVD